MSKNTIEKKIDQILEEITSLKHSFMERGYITDTKTPPYHQEVYQQAKDIVIKTKKASASLLQRKLKIGYAHAAMIMDELEHDGIIGPGRGVKPREVLY